MMLHELLVVRLVPHATLPFRASVNAAGYDLHACDSVTVPAGQWAVVPTGLAVRVPEGTYGRIAPRSGLAVKHGVDVLAGVVDADYTGEVKIVVMNHGRQDIAFSAGDRVAQLVLERIELPRVVEVTQLPATMRGEGGFGSTNL